MHTDRGLMGLLTHSVNIYSHGLITVMSQGNIPAVLANGQPTCSQQGQYCPLGEILEVHRDIILTVSVPKK